MNGTGDFTQTPETEDGLRLQESSKFESNGSDIDSELKSQSCIIDFVDEETKLQFGYDSAQIKETLENIDDESLPPQTDNRRDLDSATTRLRKDRNERIQNIIIDAKNKHSTTLDLRNECLKQFPLEILELSDLQYLYLEGNELTSLPDNFFDCLPELRWLDLRRNYLSYLPSLYIGSHKNIKTLLLEGNELKTLPLEISLIPTLNGLNIHNNPLEFPPLEVIERGTHVILQFLRDLLKAKTHGKLGLTKGDVTGSDLDESTDSDDKSWSPSRRNRSQKLQREDSLKSSPDSALSDSELFGPMLSSAALHKPTSYFEMKEKQKERVRKAGASGTVEKKRKGRERLAKMDMYPEPPPADRITKRFMDEQILSRERDLNEKEHQIIQRRKNGDQLQQWRHDGKMLQQERHKEAMLYGGAKEKVDIAEKAPYGIEKKHLKIPTNKERIAEAVKESHEKIRHDRPISPVTQAQLEAEQVSYDKQLEKRIKAQMLKMRDRRLHRKGTPQEEMEASRKELEIASQLQSEIERRRKALEYRYATFSG